MFHTLRNGLVRVRRFVWIAALSLLIWQAQANPVGTELPGFASRFVDVNGIKLHYVDEGEGQAIVFLHGYPFFWYGWKPLLSDFRQTHRVIAPDNRGYNLSDKPEAVDAYRLDVLVEDVRQLAASLVPGKQIVLVGHDWGGTLAWSVAKAHPELVSKLIVINAPPYNVLLDLLVNHPGQRKASAYMEILKSGKVEQQFAQVGPDMLWNYGFNRQHEKGVLSDDDKTAYYAAWTQPGALRAALNWYRANVPKVEEITEAHYWPSREARVTVPSLLLWTDGERVFVPDTPGYVSKVTDSLSVVTIKDSGHSPFMDQPAKVSEAIRTFLAQ